jgi:hypothetical protein
MRWTERCRLIGVAALGMLLAATPLALWIAWTAALVLWVMLLAMVSAALLVLLTRDEREGSGSAVALPEEFIDEVQQLFPLTYHHSRFETPRFRRAMQRLSRLLQDLPARGT